MKLIRKNKKDKDCSVVAAFNVASWCNLPKTYKEIECLAKSCGYNPKNGMYVFQFSNLMKKMKIPIKKIKPKDMREIEKKLHFGRFFIFLYRSTGFITGHVIVVFSDHTGKVNLINPDSYLFTWKEFISDINNNGMSEFNVFEIPNRKSV